MCCISFDSYIKPQLSVLLPIRKFVVYLLIPTSNHNDPTDWESSFTLYIFWFLHQTTTQPVNTYYFTCCISFDSYIKPQLASEYGPVTFVVYLLIPTSNHNAMLSANASWLLYIFWFLHQTTTQPVNTYYFTCCISFDSYIKPQLASEYGPVTFVVYLLIPTSNHNAMLSANASWLLYIFWFLHQTTTQPVNTYYFTCCISFDSYIKPQLCSEYGPVTFVVYLLIPTSNHNYD